MEAISLSQVVPFSKDVFEMIIEQFNLPSSTPWAFGTDESHFQKYNLDSRRWKFPRTGKHLNVQFDIGIDRLHQGLP